MTNNIKARLGSAIAFAQVGTHVYLKCGDHLIAHASVKRAKGKAMIEAWNALELALGNFYYAHESAPKRVVLDRMAKVTGYAPVGGAEVYTGRMNGL